jgi:hypothetical protein
VLGLALRMSATVQLDLGGVTDAELVGDGLDPRAEFRDTSMRYGRLLRARLARVSLP